MSVVGYRISPCTDASKLPVCHCELALGGVAIHEQASVAGK